MDVDSPETPVAYVGVRRHSKGTFSHGQFTIPYDVTDVKQWRDPYRMAPVLRLRGRANVTDRYCYTHVRHPGQCGGLCWTSTSHQHVVFISFCVPS